MARYRTGDYPRAAADLEKSRQLRGAAGESPDFFFLAMVHHRLGEPVAARRWYQKGVQWMNEWHPHDVELDKLRAEAEEVLGIRDAKQENN